jgi:hypothetical protein
MNPVSGKEKYDRPLKRQGLQRPLGASERKKRPEAGALVGEIAVNDAPPGGDIAGN